MTFTITNLVGSRALVQGTDRFGVKGEVVLDASQWIELQAHTDFNKASADFDAAVEKFFEPLTKAQDKLADAMKAKLDDVETLVLEEAVEGSPGREARVVRLTKDSQVLRLIEEGKADDRLIWVNDTLEITEASGKKKRATKKA